MRFLRLYCFFIINGLTTFITGALSYDYRPVLADDGKRISQQRYLYNGQNSDFNSEEVVGGSLCEEQNRKGICYGEVTCRRFKGTVMGYCNGLQGACCVFKRGCGGRTKQTISLFKNKKWPLEQKLSDNCDFSVLKRNKHYCGLRIEIHLLRLPGRVGSCSDTFLWITGIPNKLIELICGHFVEKTYDFNITTTEEISLRLRSYSRYKASWSITARQLLCSEFRQEKIPRRGDGGLGVIQHPIITTTTAAAATTTTTTPTTTTTTTTTTTPNPPTSTFIVDTGTCGRKGNINLTTVGSSCYSNDHTRRFRNLKSKSSNDRRESEFHGFGKEDSQSRQTEIKWTVPNLEDTYFHKVLGSPSLLDDRITGGDLATPGEFPWQAALLQDGGFHCGATLLNDQFVITAAHCVQPSRDKPSRLKVILGDWDLSDPCDLDIIKLNVRYVVINPNYSRYTLQNDIALVKFTRRVRYTENIYPICLPSKSWNVDGKLATVTGWGKNKHKRLAPQLKKLVAAVIDNRECGKRWSHDGADNSFIVDTMLCMDSQDGDSCNGDSGGPSVVEESGIFGLVGVVSFGSGSCVDETLPGVYTRVSSFLDWIEREMDR